MLGELVLLDDVWFIERESKDRNVKPRRRAQEFEVGDEVWS